MAVTQNSYTQSGDTTKYAFTFPYLKASEVKVQIDATVTTAFTLFNATTVQLNTAPADGAKIKIYRETDTDSLAATFYAGSAIKSEDLNDNFTQNLHTTQEVNARYLSNLGGTMVGDMTMAEDVDIIFEGATDNEHQTRLTVEDPDADRTITLPNVTGTVVTTGNTGIVTSAMITDGTIVNADINTSAAIAQSKLNIANATTSAAGYQSAADKTKLDGIDTGAKDDQTAAEIRVLVEAASDSNVFTDADHTKLNAIEDNATADQTATEIRSLVESASDSNVFTDADHSKLNAIEDNATADQTVDEIKSLIAGSPLDASHLAANSVTTSEIADNELTTLAGMEPGTASILAGGTPLTATLAEINTVVDGKSVETTISNTDAAYPTSGAVVDYVAAQIAPLGGLEVIANEDSFPTQPASGVVISIADAGGIVVNGSGVSTTARTSGNGSDNVTINGFPSSLYSTTLADNMGLMVSSTGSNNTYTYHKLLGKEDDIKQLSDDINDFAARYRVASSAPSSSLDNGDLWYDTSNAKMMVYNSTASAWEEVTSTGDFYINTISSYSGTGGNSATFNGSAYRFVLSNPPQAAQQLIVSVNGVLQKPNSGTGQPSEGFALNGSSIVFSAAPPTSSPYFIITVGSTVAIGTPSDNTVSTAKIQNLAVTGDKIATNLDLADNKKIRFGTGNDGEIYFDGTDSIFTSAGKFRFKHGTDTAIKTLVDGGVYLSHDNSIKFYTTASGIFVGGHIDLDDNSELKIGTEDDLKIYHNGNSFITTSSGYLNIDVGNENLYLDANEIRLRGDDGGETLAKFIDDGAVELYYDNTKRFETTDYGNSVHGHFDIATDGDKLRMGGSYDLEIWHSGNHAYIKSITGNVAIESVANVNLKVATNELGVNAIANGAVELHYDGVKKLETHADGVTFLEHAFFGDGDRAKFGTGNDLQIFHTGGAHSHILNRTNNLYIQTPNYVEIGSTETDGSAEETSARFIRNGSVELYYNDTKVIEAGPNASNARVSGFFEAFWDQGDAQYVYNGTNYGFHKLQTSVNNWIAVVENSNNSAPYGLLVKFSDASPDNNTHEAIAFADDSAGRYKVYADGDVWTSDAGTLTSDETLKENITDATSKLEDLKKLKVRNFNWKSSFHPEKSKKKQLGFIAQEVEEVFPALVTEHDISPDAGDKDHTPVMKKAIKAAWDPIIIKAMQELIAKVETLETKVAALEAK